jgi:hypothetical protein
LNWLLFIKGIENTVLIFYWVKMQHTGTVRWPGKTGGAIGFALIFFSFLYQDKKEKRGPGRKKTAINADSYREMTVVFKNIFLI